MYSRDTGRGNSREGGGAPVAVTCRPPPPAPRARAVAHTRAAVCRARRGINRARLGINRARLGINRARLGINRARLGSDLEADRGVHENAVLLKQPCARVTQASLPGRPHARRLPRAAPPARPDPGGGRAAPGARCTFVT